VTSDNPEPEPTFDEAFIQAGRPEASAEERLAKARRIARENNRLERAGEIASGTGKPAFRRRQRRQWFLIGAIGLAVSIVVIAVLASR
jgi:hypothetical protein